MPTYQYECSGCGHGFEVLQSMAEAPLTKCPACGESTLTRLIGLGSGIIFKGSGFYETDYKRKAPALDGSRKETTESSESGPCSDSCRCHPK